MKVLIACEESQTVCKAFRRHGHEAYSCDLVEPSGGCPEWHIQDDALKVMRREPWDLIIAHPPCTYLSNVANRMYSLDRWGDDAWRRLANRWRAAAFFIDFILTSCPKVAVENPVGIMNTWYRKPDQIIDPYMFAAGPEDIENYQRKRTCLWLKGLPLLKATNNFPPPEPILVRKDQEGRVRRLYYTEYIGFYGRGSVTHKDRTSIRSKTFPGIAEAMAVQWGGDVS